MAEAEATYQQILPGFLEALGIENGTVRAISQRPIEESPLIEKIDSRFQPRFLGALQEASITTESDLLHLDPDNPPPGIGKTILKVIRKFVEENDDEIFFREGESTGEFPFPFASKPRPVRRGPINLPTPPKPEVKKVNITDNVATWRLPGRYSNLLRQHGITTKQELQERLLSGNRPRRFGAKAQKAVEEILGEPLIPEVVPVEKEVKLSPLQEALATAVKEKRGEELIESLGLGARVYNLLKREGFTKIGDLHERLLAEQRPRDFGNKSQAEFLQKLTQPPPIEEVVATPISKPEARKREKRLRLKKHFRKLQGRLKEKGEALIGKTLNLKQAAAELDVSDQSICNWALLALDHAVAKGNLKIFSPTAFSLKSKTIYFNLTDQDLRIILALSPQIHSETTMVGKAAREARKRLFAKRAGNVTLDQAATDLFGSSAKRKRVEDKINDGTLSLGDHSLLEARTVGLPPDAYKELKLQWQEKLFATLSSHRQLVIERQRKNACAMSHVFKKSLGREKNSRCNHLAARYLAKALKPYGIEIMFTPHSSGVHYTSYTDKEGKAKITELFQSPPQEIASKVQSIRTKTTTILDNGFETLAEYQEFCPDDFQLSLLDTLRLLGLSLTPIKISLNIEPIKSLFAEAGLKIKEVFFDSNQTRKAHYLSLKELAAHFEELPKDQALREKLISLGLTHARSPSISSLYRQGETHSLNTLLKTAGFGRFQRRKVGKVASLLQGKLEIDRIGSTYQLPKENLENDLEVLNKHRKEILELLTL